MVIYKLTGFIKQKGGDIVVGWGQERIRSSCLLLGLYEIVSEG